MFSQTIQGGANIAVVCFECTNVHVQIALEANCADPGTVLVLAAVPPHSLPFTYWYYGMFIRYIYGYESDTIDERFFTR